MLYLVLFLLVLLCISAALNVFFFRRKKSYETFVREIAHDLGNACGILQQAAALCAVKEDPYAHMLQSQGSFAVLLCRELCTHGGKRQRRLEDAAQCLHETCKRMDHYFRARQIEVEFEQMGNCLARIDRLCLERLLQNLLTNAAEAMQDGGKILVQVDGREDDHITVSVQDTGHGMTKEELVRMFRSGYTSKSDCAGHGLGLSSSVRMARLHGGELQARSQKGKGTQMYFRLAR